MLNTSPLSIDIVSDVVCPWCYIGKRRLEAALARRASNDAQPVQVRWLAFQLNPDIPAGGVDRRSYLEQKFGGPERAKQIYARVKAAGDEVGIPFDFERIVRQPNTVNVHRLIAWAQDLDLKASDALIERLFRGYFVEGIDIGDIDALARLACDAGFDADRRASMAHFRRRTRRRLRLKSGAHVRWASPACLSSCSISGWRYRGAAARGAVRGD